MSVIIKDMEMPVDCLACRISCENENYLEEGRPFDCPLEEAKTGDLISRADAMARIANDNVVGGMERINEYNNSTEFNDYLDGISDAITTVFCDVPSADITETDGVITIEKQSAKDVGEIKHIIIRSPNYTRYFYNESMPTSAEAVHKPDYSYEADMVRRLKETLSAEAVQGWIPFKKRPLTDEEKQEYPDWTYTFDCPLPDDEEEILLSNGKYVWTDTFINDGECYLDGGDDIDDGMAWMPLPKPYESKTERRG